MLVVLHQYQQPRDVVALSCERWCEHEGRVRAGRAPRAVRLVGGAAKTTALATMRGRNSVARGFDAAYANTFDLESAEGRKVAKVSIWLMLITDVDSPLRCTMRTVQELWQGRGEAFAQLRLGARDHNKLTRNVVDLAALILPCFPGGEA